MNQTSKPKTGKKKILRTAVLSVSAMLVVIALALSLYINGMLSKINYVKSLPPPAVSSESGSAGSQAEVSSAQSQGPGTGDSAPIAYDRDVFNILLIGCDSRSRNDAASRSDSMILLSINQKSHRIILTSIMRDIYLNIPGYGDNRLNAAFAYGGAILLMKTVEQDFRIRVDRYISVDFFTFMDIIDKLGGVNLDVSDAELPVLNNYIKEINRIKGLPEGDGYLLHAGTNIHLTGKQAVGFSRIRYVGNADFGRTQRQRTILTQIYAKLKGQSILGLNDILSALLPDVTTNLSKGELLSLMVAAPNDFGYTVEQARVPVDGSYSDAMIRGMDVLQIDFDRNRAEMQKRIYG